jgi:hypothetical protein
MTPPARALHYAKQRKLPAQHLKAIQNAESGVAVSLIAGMRCLVQIVRFGAAF